MTRCRLRSDARGATALEFALVFPTLLLFIFGMISVYSLTTARRAMDFGLERALRYAAIHAGTPSSTLLNTYCVAATIISAEVGDQGHSCTAAAMTVSPTPSTVGKLVSITTTFTWTPPYGYSMPGQPAPFVSTTMTATGKIWVLH